MDLRERLTRWAHAHPRALVVDAPGQGGLRWEVEAALDERGWELAASPAETDVLIVVGEPAPALTDAIDVLWSQVPRPRNAVVIAETSTLNQQLDAAIDGLVASSDPQLHDPSASDPEARLAAAQRPADEEMDAGHAMGGHDMGGHAGHDMGGRAGHDMGGHDMREHAGHDMSGHDMSGHDMHHGGMVAGLPMAQTARDRDGLDLDTLAVALGPVLPGWPTGLVLRAQLHGDVLSDVVLSWLAGGRAGTTPPEQNSQVAALDHLARFLVVAGWPTQARQARLARAGLSSLDPAVRARARAAASKVAGRVRRSRSLAWSVRGIGQLPTATPAASHAEEAPGSSDVLARLRQWCDRAQQPDLPPAAPVELTALARALDGAELAAARLVVASVVLEPVSASAAEAMTGG